MSSNIVRLLSLQIILLITGCTASTHYQKSSVVDYLYSDKGDVVIEQQIPHLKIPMNVGIAFVPSSSMSASGISDFDKQRLLGEIANQFDKLEFVRELKVVPPAYLSPRGGFENLDQVKTVFGIDVIALVSYDQISHTDQGFASLTYWTIVGAYIVPGDSNTTKTLLDVALYDIDSRNLLFRAPGTSKVKSRSTAMGSPKKLRTDSTKGFHKASEELVLNLNHEIDKFKIKLEERPDDYAVTYGSGYSGSTGFGFLMLAVALIASKTVGKRKR